MAEDEAEFWEWYERGREKGWVEEACATHDGVPETAGEEALWEEGGDPCQHVLRVWGPGGKATFDARNLGLDAG